MKNFSKYLRLIIGKPDFMPSLIKKQGVEIIIHLLSILTDNCNSLNK